MKLSKYDSVNTIISTFPAYYDIYKKFLKGEPVKNELDNIFNPVYKDILVHNYSEIMVNVKVVDSLIKENYTIEQNTPFAVLDYLEFIYGNVFYETFIFGLNNLPKEEINLLHVIVLRSIIDIEIYKYNIYKKSVVELDINSLYLPSMVKRSYNCELKISFALKKLKEYLYIKDLNLLYEDGKNKVIENDIELRPDEVKDCESFMKLPYKKF